MNAKASKLIGCTPRGFAVPTSLSSVGVEFGGESDHVLLLIDIHPTLDISVMINNFKTASARRARNRFAEHLAGFYKKPQFWHQAYFVGSVGGATLETVRADVDAQGMEEHARKAAAKAKSKPPA